VFVVKRVCPLSGLPRAAALAIALLGFWIYLWLFVDTSLLYHLQRRSVWFPAPPCQRVFASDTLARPGGPVDYASSYLSQLYFYPAVGAVVVTAVAGLLALASAGYLVRALGRAPKVLHLVPALLIALPFARYTNPLAPALAVLAATGAAWAYVALPKRWAPARVAAFAALTAACYGVAAGASLLMTVLCILDELLARRWRVALACLALGAATPLAWARIANVRLVSAYGRLLPGDPGFDPVAGALTPALYLALPVLVIGIALIRIAFGGRPAADAGGAGARRLRPSLPALGGLALLLGLWAPSLIVLDDPLARALATIDRGLDNQDWDSVIATAGRLEGRSFDRVVSWDVNRALCHTGRLSSEMFRFPQSPVRLMPDPRDLDPQFQKASGITVPRMVNVKCMDVLYDLGRLNEAELVGHEVWELVGRQSRVTRMLAMINVAKGQPEVARAFLNSMTCDPIWGGWAKGMLENLRADPGLSGSPEIKRLRDWRVTEDRNQYMPVEDMLAESVEDSPSNRMAYEYLMAYYLLTRDLGKFIVHSGHLADLGYPRLPVHYEEALLLYGALAMKDVQVPGYEVRPQAAERLKEFLAAMESYGADREGARRALAGQYGGSYEFYYFFGGQGTDR
jgi:hypothetical protein